MRACSWSSSRGASASSTQAGSCSISHSWTSPIACYPAGNEQGLLSVAFEPEYTTTGRFYVDYTRKNDGATVIERYQVSPSDPNVADKASASVVIVIQQPEPNHNGGLVKFGPDGYLYVGMGDGGGQGDQHGPIGNGQNQKALLGKLLRLDVVNQATYAIPPSNPFGTEIWAYGLRNPWRFSFDRATNDLYIADVGQNTYEEVDFQPVASTGGENYGWRIMEGLHCYNPQTGCDQTGLVLPGRRVQPRRGRLFHHGWLCLSRDEVSYIERPVFLRRLLLGDYLVVAAHRTINGR